jgi:hypothetical protein
MDIDAKYPALSELAVANSLNLSTIADSAHDHDEYLTLADCCQLARDEAPRWSVDHYHYLATLNLFLKLLPNYVTNSVKSSFKNIWERLYKRSNSAFLDVLAEATWVIHLHSIVADFKIDVPFNTPDGTKDADIKLCSNGNAIWLDVVNVQLTPLLNEKYPRFVCFKTEIAQERILSKLCYRAVKKYNKKFKEALVSGSLHNASVGILICIVKSAKNVIPPFIGELKEGIPVPPPSGLFSKTRPGLNLVKVFNLGQKDGQEHLEPIPVFEWVNAIY